MVAQDYGYTSIENERNFAKSLPENTPFYIEEVASVNCENNLDLTPIQRFYDGANVFITGSTGFLGKLLVEKLLRSCPTISTIYLLIRNKKGKNMEQRIDEMFEDVPFDRLRKECPKFGHKVVGVAGDCLLPDLGLSVQDRRLLIDETNIIFHVAATVRFDEKIKTAVAINIRSCRDLLRLSKNMKNLKSFIHVSTVYGNCPRKCIEEKIYPSPIDGRKLILVAENLPDHILDEMTPKFLGDYPNTYAFTKQIAEDVVKHESENMPVGIFRPAIVISTYKEPLRGWINNMYGPTGVFAGAGVGLLRVLHCDPDIQANLVPADMCVNSLITSAWEVGESFKEAVTEQRPYDIPVYNYESGSDQPLTWFNFMRLAEKYGFAYPSIKSIWYYCFSLQKHFTLYLLSCFLLHTLPALLTDTVLLCMWKKPRLFAAYKKIHRFTDVISYFSTKEWDVRSDRVRRQKEHMCDRDHAIFFSDIKQLDWEEFMKAYGKGVRLYLLQDPSETLEKARAKFRRFYYAHQVVKGLVGAALLWILFLLIKYCFEL